MLNTNGTDISGSVLGHSTCSWYTGEDRGMQRYKDGSTVPSATSTVEAMIVSLIHNKLHAKVGELKVELQRGWVYKVGEKGR
jgi:hypothetical protein